MVYKLEVPCVNSLDKIDITSVFNLNEWYFEQPVEYNKSRDTVAYDLDYGEHLLLHLRCNKDQCSFDVMSVGVYDDKEGKPELVKIEEYNVNFNRSSISDIASMSWAPAVLRNFMTYLRCSDIPDYWYEPKDVCQVIEQIRKFFTEYFGKSD